MTDFASLPIYVDIDAITAAVIARLPPPPTSALNVWHGNSGDASERAATLPMPTEKRVVFSVEVPDLAIGDVLIALGEIQVTNPYTYNAMLGSQVILADTPTATAGTEVTEAATTNITPAMHHYLMARVGSHVASRSDRRFANLVAYASASLAQTGDALTVDNDYGRLAVLRVRS